MKQKFKEQQAERDAKDDRPLTSSPAVQIMTTFDFMRQARGPMALLKECHHSHVRVLIRRKRRVACLSEQFALVEGQLILFDRHLNLVLYEAKESIQTSQSPDHDDDVGGGDVQDDKPKLEAEKEKQPLLSRERFLNRVFIRGDSVVYVTHGNK